MYGYFRSQRGKEQSRRITVLSIVGFADSLPVWKREVHPLPQDAVVKS